MFYRVSQTSTRSLYATLVLPSRVDAPLGRAVAPGVFLVGLVGQAVPNIDRGLCVETIGWL